MCDSNCDCKRGFKTYGKPKNTDYYNDKLKRKNRILEDQNYSIREQNDDLKSRDTKLENKVYALRIENDLLRSKLETAEGNFKDVMDMMKEAGINGSELGMKVDTLVEEIN